MGHPIASNVRSMLHEGKTMIRCLPHCELHTSWLRREPPTPGPWANRACER